MKKLLTFFSAFIFAFSTSVLLISCTSETKDIIDDKDEISLNQDIEILNKIKEESSKAFKIWWQKQELININDYHDQIASFTDLVPKLKIKDKLTLTEAKIKEWRFLNQLYIDFKAEFDNINEKLRSKYSNYYGNTMPLSLGDKGIQFTLYYINFDKITKLIVRDLPEEVLGITIKFNIIYEIKFKQLQVPDEINGLTIVTNNLDVVNDMQNNVQNYFVTFIDNIFKEQDYKIIAPLDKNFNQLMWSNTIWPIITKVLENKNILFAGSFQNLYYQFNDLFTIGRTFTKSDSVLTWAGEGYYPAKLTAEKFLEFYKRRYSLMKEGNFYLKANIKDFVSWNFMIENLPFKKEKITLKTPIKILMAKEKVDQDLAEFAKIVIDFWHYYKLETYYKNHKLVFNIKSDDFKMLTESDSISKQNSKTFDIDPIFKSIFNIFQNTSHFKKKFMKNISHYTGPTLLHKFNLIKEKQFWMIKAFKKCYEHTDYYPYYDINFGINGFAYSFFFQPDWSESNIDQNEFTFLQIIEFKVI